MEYQLTYIQTLNNRVSTCTNELFKITYASKVVSVCPVVKHVAVNTDIICKHVSTETVTPVVSKETMTSFDDFAATHATQTVSVNLHVMKRSAVMLPQ